MKLNIFDNIINEPVSGQELLGPVILNEEYDREIKKLKEQEFMATPVFIYRLGPDLPEGGVLVEEKTLGDFDIEKQLKLIKRKEFSEVAGVNPVQWGGERYVLGGN